MAHRPPGSESPAWTGLPDTSPTGRRCCAASRPSSSPTRRVPRHARSARRRPRRLLLDRAAANRRCCELVDFSLLNRCKPRLTVGAANVRTSEMRYFDSRDERDRRQAHHGVGRAAAGVSGGPHRRRALLGRRHPVEHADRGGVRRQPAPELADLRRAHLEPGWAEPGHDLAGA